MSRKARLIACFGLLSTTLIPTASLTATPFDEQATTQAAERLLNLPYGFAGQTGLIVRLKHVDSVQFYGSGADSGFSFRRSQSVLPGGLSLKLRNKGAFRWASGNIHFKKPLNVSKYNSIIIWVKTTHPGLRFWVGVQDPRWTALDENQARTDVLPFRGFPSDQTVQLVVPYSAIYSREPVDYSHLSELAFEFGEDTVGNAQAGEIDIVGLAFVRQEKPMRRVRIVSENAYIAPAPETDVPVDGVPAAGADPVPAVPGVDPVAGAAPSDAVVFSPEPIANARPANQRRHTADLLMKITEGPTFTFFRRLEKMFNGPEADTSAEVPAPVPTPEKKGGLNWPYVAAGVAGFAAFIGALWFLLVRRRVPRVRRLPKVFHSVHWPFTVTDAAEQARFQKDFWKGLAGENIQVGWLSATGLAVDKTTDEECYGSGFLMRQVKVAADAGVRLLPSVSFARTLFHYESFLANPKAYHVRPVSAADRQLSDEELKAREKKGFPVWVPSFWQNKHNMPFRVIVEYGKTPGLPASKTLIHYNATAPELRQMAIRTIEKFASIAPGVRIEDAAILLNSSLLRPARARKEVAAVNGTNGTVLNGNGHGSGGHHVDLPQPAAVLQTEFWREVITAVRRKKPDFMFIASAGENDAAELLDMGFDYVENDEVLEAMISRVRDGNAAEAAEVLTAHAAHLPQSVFDVTRLVSPAVATEVEQKQNMLSTVLLSLLPGVMQHDDNLPEEVSQFVQRTSRSTVLRKGQFVVLQTSSPNVLAFARWRRRALFLVVANFSPAAQEAAVRIDPISEGLDDNKLYLFNNALHGAPLIQSLVSSGNNGGPALALWGQNLRDAGLNVQMPGLSVKLFSVNLTRPIPSAVVKDDILTTTAN